MAMLPATLRRSGDSSSKAVDDRLWQGFLVCSPCFFELASSRLPMTACGLPDRALSQSAEQVLHTREPPRYISTNSRSFVLIHTTRRLHFIKPHLASHGWVRMTGVPLHFLLGSLMQSQQSTASVRQSDNLQLASSRTFGPARRVRTVSTSRPQPISTAAKF